MAQISRASDSCDEDYRRIIGDAGIPRIEDKVSKWEALQSKCAGSGLYEFRRGLLYIQANRLGDAKTSFDHGSRRKGSYAREYQFAYAELDLAKNDKKKAQAGFQQLTVDYPDWYLPHYSLGQMALSSGQYSEAKGHFEASVQRQPQAETYGFLATSSHQLDLHKDTIKYMNKALAADPSMAGYRNGMIATAVSAMKLGQLPLATNALSMLLKARPEVKNDEEFLKLVRILKREMERGK